MAEFGKAGTCNDCGITDFSEANGGLHAAIAFAGFIPDYLSLEDDLLKIEEGEGARNLAKNLKDIVAQTEDEIDSDQIAEAVQSAYGLDSFTEMLTPIIVKHADRLGNGDAQKGISIVACAACCYSKNFDNSEGAIK